jgi:hypothetical protein
LISIEFQFEHGGRVSLTGKQVFNPLH